MPVRYRRSSVTVFLIIKSSTVIWVTYSQDYCRVGCELGRDVDAHCKIGWVRTKVSSWCESAIGNAEKAPKSKKVSESKWREHGCRESSMCLLQQKTRWSELLK
jgi:hypothetical protein